MFRAKPHSGESLIETLTAITVLGLATVTALATIRNALLGNQIIGEKVIANNLAVEGIEVVKNKILSNYLRFPGDTTNCWDNVDAESVEDCVDGEKLSDLELVNAYRNFDPPYNWTLEEVNPSSPNKEELSLYELDHDDDPDTAPLQIYAQNGLSAVATGGLPIEEIKDHAFSRTISIAPSDEDPINSLDVAVTVSWVTSGKTHTIHTIKTLENLY